MLFLWEFSYSEFYASDVNLYVILLKFVQMIVDQGLGVAIKRKLVDCSNIGHN